MSYTLIVAEVRRGVFEERNLDSLGLGALLGGQSVLLVPDGAYEVADNGNRSSVHWDLVNIQRPEYGGGEISFDGEVIRRNGQFVPKALQVLNY